MKRLIFLASMVFVSAYAIAGHYYQTSYYPNLKEAQMMALRAENNTIDVCCYYPTEENIEALKQAKISKMIVRAGHFPSKEQLNILEVLPFDYELVLSEVFPSDTDINRMNRSRISLLRILSSDFPTSGEVFAFNRIHRVPVRFDILEKRLPSQKEMVVLRMFKSYIEVAFHEVRVPGPGYADFFNSMEAKKVFVVHEKYPYGVDAKGLDRFENFKVEIKATQRLMSQDVPVINQFKVSPKIVLSDIWPVDAQIINDINQIRANQIVIEDDGHGRIFSSDILNQLKNGLSAIQFKLFNY